MSHRGKPYGYAKMLRFGCPIRVDFRLLLRDEGRVDPNVTGSPPRWLATHPFSRSCRIHRNHSLTITRTGFLRPRACHVPTSVSATMAGFSGLRFRRVRDTTGDSLDGDQTAA